jgi:hypothetical protein
MSNAAVMPATRDLSGDDAWQLLPRTAKRARRTLEGVIGISGTEGNRMGSLRKSGEIFSAIPESNGGAGHTTTSASVSARRRTGLGASRSCFPVHSPTSGSCSSAVRQRASRSTPAAPSRGTFQPLMLQARTTTVDGIIAKVGSATLDTRSLRGGEDINLVVIGPGIVRALDNHFDTDRERSVRIEARCWKRRSFRQHLAECLVAPMRRVS